MKTPGNSTKQWRHGRGCEVVDVLGLREQNRKLSFQAAMVVILSMAALCGPQFVLLDQDRMMELSWASPLFISNVSLFRSFDEGAANASFSTAAGTMITSRAMYLYGNTTWWQFVR